MKTLIKPLFLISVLALAFASSGHAQILGSFYVSGSNTAVAAQAFIDAGVTGITSTDSVTGFNIGGTAPYTSGGLTIATTNGGPFTNVSSGVYQSGLYPLSGGTETLTLSGLSAKLEPDETYQLYVFGAAIFHTNPDIRYGQSFTVSTSYGTPAQTGSADLVGSGYGEFTLTTGLVIPNTITFDIVGSGSNPAPSPAITSFALVGPTVPEPATYALMLSGLGAVLALVCFRRRSS